jgi:hypothetical protein
MRTGLPLAVLCVALGRAASAQGASVSGQVFLREGGEPLGYTTVAILPQGTQLLTNDAGQFLLVNLPPGDVRLTFKRIGFVPKDTTLTIAANETARIRIDMTRLVIRLPAILVSGKCTNESPFESRPAVLAELFDQVTQNAERMRLLATSMPFLTQVVRVRGFRNRDNRIVATQRDTVFRRPLPASPYAPKQVIRRGQGIDAGEWVVALPELPHIADTAFTNNHCFRYAGQTRFESDSVIKVEFEPVAWLDKEVDIEGTLYLRVDDYQLVGSVTSLNRIPAQFRRAGLQEYTVRARFSEIVTGVPVLDQWEVTNRFRSPKLPQVEIGQVFNIRWTDSTAVRPDTVRRP